MLGHLFNRWICGRPALPAPPPPPAPHGMAAPIPDAKWLEFRDRFRRDCDARRNSEKSWLALRDRTNAILGGQL